MKRILVLSLTILYLAFALGLGSTVSLASNTHGINLSITVDPEAEMSVGGVISWLRFDISNASSQQYTLNEPTISCAAISLINDLPEQVSISAGAAREFLLNNINIPDSALGQPLTFILAWTDISYSVGDIYQQNPIRTPQSAEATVTIERFVDPIISISSSCQTEMAKPTDKVELVYTLENTTKFDMYNLALFDPQISAAAIPLTTTTLLAGTSLTMSYEAEMQETDLISKPYVTYTVRNNPVRTEAALAVQVTCAIVRLEMSVQTFPATTEGKEFAITVSNTGTQPITHIQLYDEINTLVDQPFDLEAGQSKSITHVVPTALSASQQRYISFHAVGIDCFNAEYIYNDNTSYEIIPYIDSTQVDISMTAKLDLYYAQGSTDGNNATVSFEITNNSQVPIFDATITELYHFADQPIASFSQLNAGVTAFSYDFKLHESIDSLAFVLNAVDSSGAVRSTAIVVLDLSSIDLISTTPDPFEGGATIGGQYDTSKITNAIRTAAIIIAITIAIGLIIILILYLVEKKQRPLIDLDGPLNHTTSRIHSGEIQLEQEQQGSNMALQPEDDDVLPFDNLGYVAPTKLRYHGVDSAPHIAKERAPMAPFEPVVVQPSEVDGDINSETLFDEVVVSQQTVVNTALNKQTAINPVLVQPTVVRQTSSFEQTATVTPTTELPLKTDIHGAKAIVVFRELVKQPLVWNEFIRIKS